MGLRHDLRQENAIPMQMANIPKIKLPPSFDWRDHNAVTPVKNQVCSLNPCYIFELCVDSCHYLILYSITVLGCLWVMLGFCSDWKH